MYIYGITYSCLEHTKRSIESIISTSSVPLVFTVIDSHSSNSPEIIDYCRGLVRDGIIKRFLAFKENCRGYGLWKSYNDFPPPDSEDIFVFTDLDLESSIDWVKETMRMHEDGTPLSGFKLDLVNYLPPNAGHCDTGVGNWLLGIDKKIFDEHFKHRGNVLDAHLRAEMSGLGGVKQSPLRLYHMGWDLAKLSPEYREAKRTVNYMSPPPNLEYELYA